MRGSKRARAFPDGGYGQWGRQMGFQGQMMGMQQAMQQGMQPQARSPPPAPAPPRPRCTSRLGFGLFTYSG